MESRNLQIEKVPNPSTFLLPGLPKEPALSLPKEPALSPALAGPKEQRARASDFLLYPLTGSPPFSLPHPIFGCKNAKGESPPQNISTTPPEVDRLPPIWTQFSPAYAERLQTFPCPSVLPRPFSRSLTDRSRPRSQLERAMIRGRYVNLL